MLPKLSIQFRFILTCHSTCIDQLELRGYYTRLRLLVEEMFDDSGEKVTLVVHSMGGPVTLYFLTTVVSQEWKDQFINAFITLSGAWSGGNSAIQAEVSGINILSSYSFLFPTFLRELRSVIRSLESLVWLLPQPSIWGDTVLVTTPNRTYTANEYNDLFTDISYPQGFEMYTGIIGINEGFPAPNVPVYCFYGTNLSTPESFIYNSSFPNVDPEIVPGDGDSVVNLLSSEICLRWQAQPQPFFTQTFPGVSHVQMVVNEAVLEAVCDVACGAGAVFTQFTVIIISITVMFSIITV